MGCRSAAENASHPRAPTIEIFQSVPVTSWFRNLSKQNKTSLFTQTLSYRVTPSGFLWLPWPSSRPPKFGNRSAPASRHKPDLRIRAFRLVLSTFPGCSTKTHVLVQRDPTTVYHDNVINHKKSFPLHLSRKSLQPSPIARQILSKTCQFRIWRVKSA